MRTEVRRADVFDDNDNVVAGWQYFITFTEDEMNAMLAGYDTASGTSPSVSICRPPVREMLNAVKEA